jgi:hypothetical protein
MMILQKSSNNILLDQLPRAFEGVPINTSFRAVLKLYRIQEEDCSDEERALKIARLFFDKNIPDDPRVWDFLMYFVTRGEEEKADTGERLFDFEIDAGRIYAAFLQSYNIDLVKQDLHWWIFLDLFRALPAGTKFQEVMDIRAKKSKPSDPPEYRTWLAKAKAFYSIGQQESPFGALFARFK